MATLVANNGETAVSRIELQPGINTVGRAEGNHHIIPHASVSSRHCEIVVNDGTITVRDLGSTNGTFVDDKPVQQTSVAHGQRLKLGSTEFVVEAPEVPASPKAGTLRVNIPKGVSVTGTSAPPVATGHTAAEAIAAVMPAAYETPSFYKQLPAAFAYPFKKSGIIMLVIGSLLFGVMEFLAKFSFWMQILTLGYLFAYMQKIIAHSAHGEDEIPGWPELTEWWSDIIQPCLFLVGAAVVSATAGLVLLFLGRDNPMFAVAAIPVLIFGAIYFPMALLAVAVSDNFLALSPHIVVPSIFKVFLPYLVAFTLLALLVGVRIGSAFAIDFVPIPFLPTFVMSFVSFYLLTVEMRVLGLMYYSYSDRLGWLQ